MPAMVLPFSLCSSLFELMIFASMLLDLIFYLVLYQTWCST